MNLEEAKGIISRMNNNETYSDKKEDVSDFLKAKGFFEALQCKEVKDLAKGLKILIGLIPCDGITKPCDICDVRKYLSQWEKAVGLQEKTGGDR